MLTFGSLFAGIGGLDLGLERAGMRCAWQCEINEYARRVLDKHWPTVRRHTDVRTFPPTDPGEWQCDLICGGFPCQDISFAGAGAGIRGERSSLWFEFARIVRVVQPRYVLVENVPALLHRGMGDVLGTLAACGYDAEWDCIPAAAVGAPHLRDRIFIVAYPNGQRCEKQHFAAFAAKAAEFDRPDYQESGPDAASRRARQLRREQSETCREEEWYLYRTGGEPPVPRVAYGIPHRVDRLRCLGNAVVPQVAEWIGRRILTAHATMTGDMP